MQAGDFNPVHTHGADYSFVLFLDVPKQLQKEQEEFKGTSAKPGELMFEYTQQAKPRWATTGQASHQIQEIFICFLHYYNIGSVLLNLNVHRISVSGNFRIIK